MRKSSNKKGLCLGEFEKKVLEKIIANNRKILSLPLYIIK